MDNGEQQFQTVRYPAEGPVRVEFRLPTGWKGDASLPGMGLFYPAEGGGPTATGGMLAVNLEAKTLAGPLSADAADAQIRAGAKTPGDVLRLGPERWVIRSKGYKEEATYRAVVHIWVLVRLVRPDLLARIGFIFTADEKLYADPGDPGYATVDLLEREVEAARVVEG